ncbi:hypothetical protein ABC382_00955 [Lysinibacillus sp. 1P01SD]|uniref:hypothetical protein n=1 Tax=Lysinibacillus sp. 1P01SD TaxID=3132285 RepID=UPI00399F0D01
MNIELLFNNYDIYVTLDDNKLYKLNCDFSKVEVPLLIEKDISNGKRPLMLLNKKQFDCNKKYLLNQKFPFKIDKNKAIFYHKIGFLNKEELNQVLIS